MDISTLLGAQTATAPAALSFGVLGGVTGNAMPAGEGLDGLDSFNQLLGNFLSVTGGEGLTGEVAAIPVEAAADGPVVTGMSTPQGLGALLGGGFKGLNLANLAGNNTATAAAPNGMEGRWLQSGINLLGGGALTGQELNPEVVEFLNDLSSAFAAANPLSEEAPAIGDGMEGEVTAQETDLLTVMQGSDGTMTIVMEKMVQLTAALTAPVIPVMTATDTAPTALGVNLTVAGTGLKALPTVPDAGPAAPAPQTAPVIPKLDAPAPAILSDAPAAQTAAAAATVDATQPAPTAAPNGMAAKTTPAAAATQPLPATPAPQTIPATPAAQQSLPVTQAASAQSTPQANPQATPQGDGGTDGAIAMPADLAAAATDDQAPVTVASAPAKAAATAAPVVNAAPAPAAERPVVAAPQADVTAAPAPQAAAKQPASDSQPVVKQPETVAKVPVATNAAPATAEPATNAAAPKPAAAAPAAPVILAKSPAQVAEAKPMAKTAEAAPLTEAPTPAETELAASEESQATDADPVTTTNGNNPAPHGAPARPLAAAAATRPALTTATRPTADTGTVPAPEEVAAEQAVSEEEEATPARRMLAPKHVGSEARAETEMAGQAQSAGQNQPATRNDGAAPTPRGTEDSLLARAVGAAGKGHESGSATDGEGSGSGFADPAPADTPDPTALHTGETGKTQTTDFAQSLRQTSAPHRPNAYVHPGQQMAIHMQRAVADGNDRVSIQLNPYELGRIDVQLEIGAEGKLRAKVMVENPQTLEMLQKDARSLEKALQDAGLQTDKDSLSFSLQDSGDQARERQDHQDQSNRGTVLASEDAEEQDPAIIAQAQIMELGRVDVRV